MLKNLASLGATGVVRNGLVYEIRPNSSRYILETLKLHSCCTTHQVNVAHESSSAHVNIENRRNHMEPNHVGRYDTETQIRKFRFTGKYPRLTIAKNLSNPNIQNDTVDLKMYRPLSCPQKAPPPSRSPHLTNPGNEYCDSKGEKALKSNIIRGSNTNLKPLRSSIFTSSPTTIKVKISPESVRKIEAMKYARSHTDLKPQRSSIFKSFSTTKNVEISPENARKVEKIKSFARPHTDLKPQRSSIFKYSPTTKKVEISPESARKVKKIKYARSFVDLKPLRSSLFKSLPTTKVEISPERPRKVEEIKSFARRHSELKPQRSSIFKSSPTTKKVEISPERARKVEIVKSSRSLVDLKSQRSSLFKSPSTTKKVEISPENARKVEKIKSFTRPHADFNKEDRLFKSSPQRSFILKSSPTTKKMETSPESARNVEKMKSNAQDSSTSDKETNAIRSTPGNFTEERNSQNVSRSHTFKRRDSVFEKKSSNNQKDSNITLDTENNMSMLSSIKNDFHITNNHSFSNITSTGPDDTNSQEIASRVACTNHHNQTINSLAPSSVAEQAESPKIQKKQSRLPKQSGNPASSEVDQISDDRAYPKKNTQSIVTQSSDNVSSDTTNKEDAHSNKQALTLRQSNTCHSLSPLIESQKVRFERNSSSPNIRASEKQTRRVESGPKSTNILTKDGSSRKSNSPSKSQDRLDATLYPGELNARKQIWNLNSKLKKKLDPDVLDRFRNRQNTLNKIDLNSLPRHDFSAFRSSLKPKRDWNKKIRERPLSKRIPEVSSSSGGQLDVLSVKSDIFELSTGTERTGTTKKHARPTESLMLHKSPSKALQLYKDSSTSRIILENTSSSKKGDKLQNNELKAGGGSSSDSGGGQHREGPPTTKVSAIYRKAGALEHRVDLNPSRRRHDFSTK